MGTYGDIRTRFEVAMQIYEAAREFHRPWFETTYNTYIISVKYKGSIIKAKTGESLRADFGEDPDEMISRMLIDAGMEPGSFLTNIIQPGDTGSKSGQFLTIELLIQKDQILGGSNFKKGEKYYIVNRVSIKGGIKAVIGKKDTSPDKLGLTKNEYMSAYQLITAANTAFSKTNLPDNYKIFLNELMDKIIKQQNYSTYQNMTSLVESNISEFTIDLGENLIDKYSIDQVSMSNIANDFGEVLGGIFLFSIISKQGSGVSYPSQSNESMIDFMFDGWKISSKAGKRGGIPSIVNLAKGVLRAYRQGDITPTNTEIELIQNIFEVLENPTKYFKEYDVKRSSDVYSTYIALANKYLIGKNSGYDFFLKSAKLNPTLFTRKEICDFLDRAYLDGNLWPVLSEYFKMTNTTPRGFENENNTIKTYQKIINDDNRFGIIFYPLTKECVEEINVRYSEELTNLVNQISTIQQLYLITSPKSSYIKFKIKSFDVANFKFVAGASAPKPLNKNIGIESL